ncbi:hypothetical protein RN001_006919 [Aquatica leii]|uniref:EF-hand domain-containing protein n=1 Tax=Aquatica leii TaxID=1421715 RepID=A0AAN7P8W3_9COLE|nr:hypothetical protein RN001_006919 [Aquatica leii]
MDSVLMTSPGNSTRIKSRLRNATSSFLVRNSKNRHVNKNIINNKNNRLGNIKHNGNLRQANNYNRNINGNHKSSNCVNNNGNTTSSTSNNHQNNTYKGTFAREVYSTICSRLGHTPHIPEDWVQTLFNDMRLYPSKSQVSEMLQCARQCGRRNGTTPFLTFGEFCVFAREMQKPQMHRKTQQRSPTNRHIKNCEVFLGGSCNPTTWRTDTAIPELQKHGITYYNPQRSIWGPELVAEEHDAKQSASVLLFVLDSQTRSVAGMIEVAYLVASDRCVVVVAHPYELGQSIMGEDLSYREYVDLVSGQSTLLTLLKTQGVKVYVNLMSALQRTTSILHSTGSKVEEQITNKLRKLRETFDLYDVNGTGELHLNDVLDAYYRLTKKTLQISELYNYLSNLNIEKNKTRISFEQFCALVAEFTTDNCTTINDDWASQPLQRQCSTNNNTHCDINNEHANCNTPNNINEREVFRNDVYLGGSVSTQNKWRENIAIPLLKKHGLTYYNPAIREGNMEINNVLNGCLYYNEDSNNEHLENCVLQWKEVIDKSKVLLFMVTSDAKSLTTMILAAHYIGLGKNNVILCIEALPSAESEMEGEKLTTQAIKDYNRGRVYLSDVAKRKKVPVFENVTEAVQCAINKCQEK